MIVDHILDYDGDSVGDDDLDGVGDDIYLFTLLVDHIHLVRRVLLSEKRKQTF